MSMGQETVAVGDREPKRRGPLRRYLARFDDGEVVRWAFRGLLLGAIGVLALDLNELVEASGGLWPDSDPGAAPVIQPVLPPAAGTGSGDAPAADPRRVVEADEAVLRRPMSFELRRDGVLTAVGTIDAGAARRLAAEIEARGEYIETVEINSPGGSLDDAMLMARMVREKGYTTRVGKGALCASSCPLFLAGGTERRVDAEAAVGVHQFYAVGNLPDEPAQAMVDAQMTTARITRHLSEMGVDPALWLHALDTPPSALYYLSDQELAGYNLVGRAG